MLIEEKSQEAQEVLLARLLCTDDPIFHAAPCDPPKARYCF